MSLSKDKKYRQQTDGIYIISVSKGLIKNCSSGPEKYFLKLFPVCPAVGFLCVGDDGLPLLVYLFILINNQKPYFIFQLTLVEKFNQDVLTLLPDF